MTILMMLQQSTILTILGMTVVFAFLWLMILCVGWVGKLVHRMGWDKDVQEPPKIPPKKAGAVTPEIASAISAAVTEFRKGE
jgi:oxaloacetate decarboxylase gamma subunit